MTALVESRGHHIAAGNAVLGLGLLALVLTLATMVLGVAGSAPPGLATTGALFVVVGAALRRGEPSLRDQRT